VSRRRAIEQRLRSLEDIREVLGAMQNLALAETRKLARFLATQQRLAAGLDAALADLVAAHPHPRAVRPPAHEACILVGSERGFCGDFNETLLEALERHLNGSAAVVPRFVTVGYKLSRKLADDDRVVERVDGATVAEDIEPVLARLVDALVRIESEPQSVSLTAVYHRSEPAGVVVQPLDPYSASPGTGRRSRIPPRLQLPPERILAEVARLSLEAQLRGILSGSLMAENLDRLRHMDAAGRHIDREAERLRLRRNSLRQEEITEEIELLLLSAESRLR